MQLKERAIVLSKIKYGESDLILKLLSSSGDVYSVIAKSALRSKKRFGGGVLEPTHYILCTLKKNDNEQSERLSVLNEAQIVDDFRGLKTDYDRLELAFHFVKTVAIVAREGDTHLDIFNLLGHALKKAETTQNLKVLKMQFDLKLLHLQGVLPGDERFVPFLKSSIKESDELNVDAGDSHYINCELEYIFANYIQ